MDFVDLLTYRRSNILQKAYFYGTKKEFVIYLWK